MSAPAASRSDSSRMPLPRRKVSSLRRTYDRAYNRFSMMSIKDVPLLLWLLALLLTGFGCMMVLSASFVESIAQGLEPYAQAFSQLRSAALGVIIMLVASLTPVTWYRNKVVPHLLLALALVMQLAVIVAGVTINGNRNWIRLGGQSLQPSEISKLLLILWLAYVLNLRGDLSKSKLGDSIFKIVVPSAVGFGALVFMILLGHDLGTVIVYSIIYVGMLWMLGVPKKLMLGAIAAVGFVGLIFVLTSPNRLDRIFAVFGNCTGFVCDQSNAGMAALATGGIWGVGLGQSRQKYSYLPEAHNDYIFAIIGEELGLVGTIMTLVLYVGLIYCAVRILLRSSDRYIRLATSGILLWLSAQMLINVAMVTGMGPVIGVPLPFVSYGGTSLMASMAAAGCLVAFARQTPLTSLAGEPRLDDPARLANPLERKDAERRAKLLPVIREEEKARAHEAPIDWSPVLARLGLQTATSSPQRRRPAPAQSGQGRGAHRPSPVRTERKRQQQTQRNASAKARRTDSSKVSASPAAKRPVSADSASSRGTTSSRGAEAAVTRRPKNASTERRATPSQTGKKVSSPAKTQPQQPVKKSSPQAVPLPPGLKPIRKARKTDR
ncbi:FtsW/RodA/SpoVE family cell cycle protein [Rothia terrae]|uniref:FtsW/RodA/SpoVE family cell cycle protein n=1 Tax=Rothia terrae TaxID=396015 RepID=UPI00381EDB75